MSPVVTWTLLALGSALAVIVIATVAAAGPGGVRQFLRDLRSGLRRGHREGPGVLDELRDAADEDAASVDQLFSLGRSDAPAYVSTQRLEVAVDRVTRAVPRPRGESAPRPTGEVDESPEARTVDPSDPESASPGLPHAAGARG